MAKPKTPKPEAEALTAALEAFKAAYPDQWAQLALCPLKYGLEEILAGLRRL